MSDAECDLTVRQRLSRRARDTARDIYWSHYDRADYECPWCGYEARGADREFAVHHRDGDWLNNHLINLLAVCYPCHRRVHSIRRRHADLEDWKQGFETLGKSDKSHVTAIESGATATDGGMSVVLDGPTCGTLGCRNPGTVVIADPEGGERVACEDCAEDFRVVRHV